MKKRYVIGSMIAILIMAFFAMSALASANSEVWLSKDSTGYPKATEIQEGDTVWVVVKDSSRGDTDQLDRIYTQILLYDVKTGAYLDWDNYDNDAAHLTNRNFLLETAPNSGLFISNVAFKIGDRKGGSNSDAWTHTPGDLSGGNWLYYETTPGDPTTITRAAVGTAYNPASPTEGNGRVENMDTLMLMYIDPDDPQDISTSLIKIEDTTSTVTWPLGNPANATKPVIVRITDLDENLTCEIEAVPVFFAINPGASVQTNTFCLFNREQVLRWYNIYMAGGVSGDALLSTSLKNLSTLTTPYGTTTTTLWAGLAMETGVGTGVFEFRIEDLSAGFPTNVPTSTVDATYHSFTANDVIVAYYLDPNDADDFQLASCYVDKADINSVWFKGTHSGEYSLGKDDLQIGVEDLDASTPCCPDTLTVHICDPHGEDDSASLELTEVGVASSQFDGTMELLPVWDALGTTSSSGYQLDITNNRFEAFNEDSIYVRYNGASAHKVSFDLVKVSDTQVFDGDTLNLTFVDASGNAVSFYQSDEIAYIKVVDLDQNENSIRAETIKSYWDGGLNKPFGPGLTSTANPYIGNTNWTMTNPTADKVFGKEVTDSSPAKIYLWNPTNGEWHAVELLETGVNTGVFMSKAGVPLYQTCVSDCLTFAEDKDTILAFYQDPSNHSDIAIAEIKVDNNASRTTFVDKDGNSVSEYKDTDSAYVLVKDRGHASETTLVDAVTIDKISGSSYSLTQLSVTDYTFITGAIPLTTLGGDTITATYVDPDDTDDTSSDSIGVEKALADTTAAFVNSTGTIVTSYTEGDSAYVKVVDQSHAGATSLAGALAIDKIAGETFSLTPLVIPGGNNYTFISGAISLTGLVDVTITVTYTDPDDPTDTATDSIPVNSAEFGLDFVTVLPNPFTTEVTFSIDGGTGFPDTFLVTVYDLAHHEVWRSEQAPATEITWDGGDLANGPYIYVVVITSSDLQKPYTKKGMVFINR